jgi:hypothetical protein
VKEGLTLLEKGTLAGRFLVIIHMFKVALGDGICILNVFRSGLTGRWFSHFAVVECVYLWNSCLCVTAEFSLFGYLKSTSFRVVFVGEREVVVLGIILKKQGGEAG